MTKQPELQNTMSFNPLIIRVLQGAAIALLLMTLFFFGDGGAWDFGFRVYFPMITASIGGGFGGLFYYLMSPMRYHGGSKKVLANIICLIVYLLALWISSVAGFAVTGDWD